MKKNNQNIKNISAGQIVLYKKRLEVRLEKETVWLTQKQMAKLFNKGIPTINEHIKNIFKEGELKKNSVIRNFRITASDGILTIELPKSEKLKDKAKEIPIN